MLSYGANTYSRMITGMPIMDGTGGFKAWKSEVLKNIDLDSVTSQGYSFQIEMNFRAWTKGYKLKELPIIFSDRTIGQSKCPRKLYTRLFLWSGGFGYGKIFGGINKMKKFLIIVSYNVRSYLAHQLMLF